MHRRPGVPLVSLLALSALAASHCSSTSYSCSAVYPSCGQTTLTLPPPSGGWTAGTYSLSFSGQGGDGGPEADGGSGSCTVTIVDPSSLATAQALCGPDPTLTLALVPVQDCTNAACDGADCCTAVPGLFGMVLTMPGLPSQVAVALSRDGSRLASDTVAPVETTSEPNGAGCGACTNAAGAVTTGGPPPDGGGD
jgi:hypothetical protein